MCLSNRPGLALKPGWWRGTFSSSINLSVFARLHSDGRFILFCVLGTKRSKNYLCVRERIGRWRGLGIMVVCVVDTHFSKQAGTPASRAGEECRQGRLLYTRLECMEAEMLIFITATAEAGYNACLVGDHRSSRLLHGSQPLFLFPAFYATQEICTPSIALFASSILVQLIR